MEMNPNAVPSVPCALSLGQLSDEELLIGTRRLVGRSNQLLASLVAHLGEVEARGIHRTRACSSLYTYCIYELRFSEDEAFRRVAAARFVRRFPGLLDALASGELHLTGLLLLGPHLRESNLVEVLRRAKHRTKREILRLVRILDPLPAVPARIEPLGPAPARGVPPAPSWENFVQATCPIRELAPGERPRDWMQGADARNVASPDDREGPVATATAPARSDSIGLASGSAPARSDSIGLPSGSAPARVDSMAFASDTAPARVDSGPFAPDAALATLARVDSLVSEAVPARVDAVTFASETALATHSRVDSFVSETVPARVDSFISETAPARVDAVTFSSGLAQVREGSVTFACGAVPATSARVGASVREPLAPERYKVQFTATEEYVRLVDQAKALLSHAVPKLTLEELQLRAMRALVAELNKKKYATLDPPNASRCAADAAAPARGFNAGSSRAHAPGRRAEQASSPRQATEQTCPPDPGAEQSGPVSQGTEQGGPATQGAEQGGPATQGAERPGPVSQGAEQSGPATQGAERPGPVSRGAEQSGPATQGAEQARSTNQSAKRPGATSRGTGQTDPLRRGRYIPAGVRRAVFEREGNRCSYVAATGMRCRETHRLEFHHVRPFAAGGEHAASNLTLRCAAHNGLAAEQDFGRTFVESKKPGRGHESAANS